MYEILETLVMILTPVLAFTSEEIWQYMPHRKGHNTESVQLNDWPTVNPKFDDKKLEEKWDRILALRDDVSKALEVARASKLIGHSLNAKVTVYAKGEAFDFVKSIAKDLITIFIVSDFELAKFEDAPTDASNGEEFEGIKVAVSVAEGEKCERCWMYSTTVGKDHNHPTLCERCATVLE
jgi:isoleucyl-tRNA synthetase